MKSAIPVFASLALLATPFARGGEPGTYEYSTIHSPDSWSVTITGYEPDSSSELVVPAEIDGIPVTAIGWEAFKDCREVTRIVLPESVTEIGYKAFFNCTQLASISLPPGLTTIGQGAFFNCRSLAEVTLPSSVTSIGSGAFFGTRLTSIWIPPGVSAIGAFAFSRCAELEAIHVHPANEHFSSVDGVLFSADRYTLFRCPEGRAGDYVVPHKVASLGGRACHWWCGSEGAFENCGQLDRIVLNDGLTSIGARTFKGCSALASLTIPESVSEIDPGAFNGCTALTALDVVAENPHYRGVPGALLSGDGTTLVRCLESRSGHFDVPAGVTALGTLSFADCAALTSIAIPEGVTAIGNSVFTGCEGLEHIQLPASLAELGSAVFSSCPRLSEIEVAEGNPNYRSIEGAVYDRAGDELLLCPPGRTGGFAIPDGVTAVASNAFASCHQLTSIVIPASVEAFDSRWALSGCTSLESIKVAEESAAFASSGGVLYDREMTSLLFCPRAKAGTYTVANGVQSIAWGAFERCTVLKEVVLPGGLNVIGGEAFEGCAGLKKIDIPDSVSEIGYEAFRACSSLVEFNIPRDLQWLSDSALIGNASLEAIHVAPGNKSYSSVDGVLFNHDRSTLIRFPRAKGGDYTVPEGVTEIRGRNYSPPMCGVGGWGWWGWGWMSAYANAVLVGDEWVLVEDLSSDPSANEEDYDHYQHYYGEGAFEGCRGLTGITIPQGVTSIGHFAFYRCTGLSSVTLPASLVALESRAFANNESLRELRFLGDVPAYLGWSWVADTSTELVIDYTLRVVRLERGWQEDTWNLEWTSVPGDLYAIEVSDDLQYWKTVETGIPGWGGRDYYTVATSPELQSCAFRVRRVGRE